MNYVQQFHVQEKLISPINNPFSLPIRLNRKHIPQKLSRNTLTEELKYK